jgi:hypothetical protein
MTFGHIVTAVHIQCRLLAIRICTTIKIDSEAAASLVMARDFDVGRLLIRMLPAKAGAGRRVSYRENDYPGA